MAIGKIIQWLMPRDERFKPLFSRQSQNLLAAAELFETIARSSSLDERRLLTVELKRIEHEGDRLTREVFLALNSTFVTPLDREDLRALASDLDDVLDALDRVGRRLVLFELSGSPPELVHFAEILRGLAQQIEAATVNVFEGAQQAPAVEEAIVRISELENEADDLYAVTIHALFRDGLPAVELLKWKEVYEGLEKACDRSKRYATVLAGVLTKIV
jgi:hypothetical protein